MSLIRSNTDILLNVTNDKLNTPYIINANNIIKTISTSTNLQQNPPSKNVLKKMEIGDEQNIKLWRNTYQYKWVRK